MQPNNKRLCRISPLNQIWHIFTALSYLSFFSCNLYFANFTIQFITFQFSIAVFVPFNVICVIKPNASCYNLCSIWFAIDQARKAIHEPGNIWRLELALRLHGEPIRTRDPIDSQLHLALLVRNRTSFKCLFGFRKLPNAAFYPVYYPLIFLTRGAL